MEHRTTGSISRFSLLFHHLTCLYFQMFYMSIKGVYVNDKVESSIIEVLQSISTVVDPELVDRGPRGEVHLCWNLSCNSLKLNPYLILPQSFLCLQFKKWPFLEISATFLQSSFGRKASFHYHNALSKQAAPSGHFMT